MHALDDAIAVAWRLESAKVVAAAARLVRDVAVAEDLAQEALLEALAHWPRDGLPERPGAWLTTVARRKALDWLRQQALQAGKHGEIAADLVATGAHLAPDTAELVQAARDDAIGDDLLRLIFIACHPVLPLDSRVALTLRLLGGLSTAEIARAFLLTEATVAQRIVRAKQKLREAGVPFEAPRAEALHERLAAVHEVVYLVFNEGYTATAGEDWMRPALAHEALRLARMLAGLTPQAAESHGLVALLELQASRLAARTDAQGEPVLLPDQDRGRWDRLLIRRGLAALERAEALAPQRGPYALQAAIAACHARAASHAGTDWARIAALYAELARRQPSPVVELNRAVAVGMAQGPAAGLAIADALRAEPALRRYHWLEAVRGDLLARLGRDAEAREALLAAAELAGNARERALLQARAQQLAAGR
jgi:RNA polymerase sigma factor (sigma-70 family)